MIIMIKIKCKCYNQTIIIKATDEINVNIFVWIFNEEIRNNEITKNICQFMYNTHTHTHIYIYIYMNFLVI